jgi:hypothetical protein
VTILPRDLAPRRPEAPRTDKEGTWREQVVEFDIAQGPKGAQAANVSTSDDFPATSLYALPTG